MFNFLQLSGTELNDLPIDQAEISGDMPTIMRELESRLKGLIRTTINKLSGMQEVLVSTYPLIALREIIVNALTHRDYSSNTPVRVYWFTDRVEVYSPGGLFGEVTVDNFPLRSSYRNPIIAEAMKTLGYVNRFGYGVQRAQKALRDNGNSPAEYTLEPHTILAVIRTRPE